jgi:hypothetical protein
MTTLLLLLVRTSFVRVAFTWYSKIFFLDVPPLSFRDSDQLSRAIPSSLLILSANDLSDTRLIDRLGKELTGLEYGSAFFTHDLDLRSKAEAQFPSRKVIFLA